MKISVAVCALALTLCGPALALTAEEQAKIDNYRVYLQNSYKVQNAYKARRVAEEKARCAKLGGVSIGMKPEQIAKSCWGKPIKINETLTSRGNHEQWVYGGGYLYLDNGVVTSIQTSR